MFACRPTRTTFTTALLLALLLVMPLAAQERSAGPSPNQQQGDSSSQQTLATGLKANLVSLTNVINNTCTGGQTHGQTWTIACGTGFTGTQTLVCVHGQTAVQSSSCQSALPCGSHPSGSEWAGSGASGCPSGTTGTMMYECLNGNIVLDPATTSCQAHECNGTTYTQACPTTVDGIAMTGNLTFQCTSNNLSLTGNTCHTYGKPCGSVANGGTSSASCAAYNPGLTGTLTLVCNDGATTISSLTCAAPQWHTFIVTLASNSNCSTQHHIMNCNGQGQYCSGLNATGTDANACSGSTHNGYTDTGTDAVVIVNNIRETIWQLGNIPAGSAFQNVSLSAGFSYYGTQAINLGNMAGSNVDGGGSGGQGTCDNQNNTVAGAWELHFLPANDAISARSYSFLESYACQGGTYGANYNASVSSITITGQAYY